MNEAIFGNYSAQQLDVQYNNRARVPDHEQHLERWKRESEVTRLQRPFTENIRYGAGERETLDIFPARADGAPVLVFIHGGYWQALNKSYFSFIAPSLQEQGFTVVVLNYPLCPDVRLLDIVRSLRWAMVYLYRNIERYAGKRDAFYLVGHSAGGHLAAMLLATVWHELDSSLDMPFIRGGISLSGIFELEPLRHTFLNQALRLEQAEIDELSPVNLVPPASGELALLVGGKESDEFKRQSRALEQIWSRAQFTVNFQTLDKHDHFSIVDEITMPGGFVQDCLSKQTKVAGDVLTRS